MGPFAPLRTCSRTAAEHCLCFSLLQCVIDAVVCVLFALWGGNVIRRFESIFTSNLPIPAFIQYHAKKRVGCSVVHDTSPMLMLMLL